MSAPDRPYRAMVLLGRAVFRGLALERRVDGAEHLPDTGGAVLAITHFGYLDFALAEWAVWRRTGRFVRFLVTARAFEHPVAGPLLRGMGHIPVERAAGAGAYRHAVAALRAGELLGVFPEGQVNRDDVGPLKSGAVRMAAQAGVPILPVVVWGGQRLLTKGQGFSLRRAWRSIVRISIGTPILLGPTSGNVGEGAGEDPGEDAGEDAGALDVEAETLRLRDVLRDLVRHAREQ